MVDRFATYVGTYRFEGAEWSIRLQARSPGEAQARLRAMGLGRIDGELQLEIPAGMPGMMTVGQSIVAALVTFVLIMLMVGFSA